MTMGRALIAMFTALTGLLLPNAATAAVQQVGECVIAPQTQCRRANLAGADLAGGNPAGADLRDANLRSADLRRATLDRAVSAGRT
jgi:uncharacterized protein YjbI with pentapeptide repeats